MKENLLKELRQTLEDNVDPKTLENSKRFFKKGEEAKVHGISMAKISKIGKYFYQQIKDMPKHEIFDICEELWKSEYLEQIVIACICAESLEEKYETADFNIFEHWVKDYVSDWGACDTLCNHTVGNFVMIFPQYISELKKWTKSSNRWVKRAAVVTLIIPARKGLFLRDIFEIADSLLLDKDDMVQKGYGWMLKATSEAYPKEVYEYILSKRAVMPRTALRYAIEKMSPEWKKEAMKK